MSGSFLFYGAVFSQETTSEEWGELDLEKWLGEGMGYTLISRIQR
ncbi:MAG: hypothetical protein VKL59_26130 [Nostocaceae cyanobacterium]|nr:hypothetical protein [Nostocaceae cyanobacterium]